MKKIYSIISVLFLLANIFQPTTSNAQAPEKISYQAVIRNSTNQLVTNKQVGMRISIQKFTFGLPPTYTNVYVETQKPTTNDNGLVSVQIGGGTIVGGTFNSINWGNGTYYIKTETDPTGGTNYTITGQSQILSVPYALHAQTVENVQTDATLEGKGNATQPLKLAQQSATEGQLLEWTGTTWKPGLKLYTYWFDPTEMPHRISYQDLGLTNEEEINSIFILNLEVGWNADGVARDPSQYRSLKDGIYYELCLPTSGYSGIKVYYPDKIEYSFRGRIIYIK